MLGLGSFRQKTKKNRNRPAIPCFFYSKNRWHRLTAAFTTVFSCPLHSDNTAANENGKKINIKFRQQRLSCCVWEARVIYILLNTLNWNLGFYLAHQWNKGFRLSWAEREKGGVYLPWQKADRSSPQSHGSVINKKVNHICVQWICGR